MDLLLELPLDAMASRLQSLPAVVGLLSTWVAVLAAALGLWHIRLVGSSKSRSVVPAASVAGLSSPPPELAAAEPERSQVPEDQEDRDGPSTPSRCDVAEGGATTKTRFTAYYGSSHAEDGDAEEDVGEDFKVADLCCGVAVAAPWSGDWASLEDVMTARKGDLGWYRYQDRTAINGSVVRLWDGGRDRGPFMARQRRIA